MGCLQGWPSSHGAPHDVALAPAYRGSGGGPGSLEVWREPLEPAVEGRGRWWSGWWRGRGC